VQDDSLRTILFLENRPARQELIRRAFAAYSSAFSVAFAASPEEALRSVQEGQAAVLFIASRDLSGELAQALTRAHQSVRAVLMVDRLDAGVEIAAIRQGLDECVLDADSAAARYPVAAQLALARRQAARDELDRSRALVRSQKQWMSILDAITDYLFVVDEDHRVVRVNTAFAALLGREPREIAGRPCGELFCGDLLSEFPVTGPGRQGSPRIFEKTIGGQAYQVSIFPLTENDRTYTIHVLKNITELKRLKDQLYHADRLASLGQLVSGFAHEINNPLTGTIAYSELLLLKPLDEEIRAEIEKILNSAERCKKIVDNLLTFSRQRAPAKSLESFNALLDRVIDLRCYALRSNGVEVVRDYDDVGTVFVDAPQIQQSVLNILLNAEQALTGAPQGKARIAFITRLDREHRRVTARIEDNGPGIPPRLLSRIFDPFFTTKPVGVGTGLGLSIAHGIVSEHGGTLHAENGKTGGAVFVIELPTGAGATCPSL
jgi:PAS domain S-box-containing protein